MPKEYLYIKKYALKTNGAILLLNPENALSYIQEKINLLLTQEKETVILNLINEFKEIYNYDVKNAIVPPVEKEIKKIELLKQDLVLYFGNIFSNYHTILMEEKRGIPTINMPKFIIDYNELYDEALTDYFRVLKQIEFQDIFKFKAQRKQNTNTIDLFQQTKEMIHFIENNGIPTPMKVEIPKELQPVVDEKSYLASYIFPALIDHLFILKIHNYFIHLGINTLKKNKIELTKEEKEIIDFIKGTKVALVQGTEQEFLNKISNIFYKYKVFEDKNICDLIKEKNSLTIGSMLCDKRYKKAVKKIVKREYMYIFHSLFINLNIRNNIMHLNDINANYFSICFCSIMLELLWAIYENRIFILKDI